MKVTVLLSLTFALSKADVPADTVTSSFPIFPSITAVPVTVAAAVVSYSLFFAERPVMVTGFGVMFAVRPVVAPGIRV